MASVRMRRASTPVDHLVAEMAAMPIASRASLELTVTDLSPHLPNRLDPARLAHGDPGEVTGELWRRSEQAMLRAFPAVALEELVAIRDMIWFPEGARVAPTIGDYLRSLAQMFLAQEGAGLVAVLPAGHLGRRERAATSAESRRTLRWLLLALPPDLLSACVARTDEALELALTNPTLDRMLRLGGFAELHLHLGAAVEFSTIWHALVATLGSQDFRADAFASPGAELDEGRSLGHWVLRAGVVRLLLAQYLMVARPNGPETSLDAFLNERGWAALSDRFGPGARAVMALTGAELGSGALRSTDRHSFAVLQQLYRELSHSLGGQNGRQADSLADIEQLDPMATIFPVRRRSRSRHGEARHGRVRTAEQRFVGRALAYLDGARDRNEPDEYFARLFWQVVRIRCLVYRHIVQRPLTPGLQWFVRFFARSKPARRRLSWSSLLDSAADLDGAGRGLRSLEVRTSPPDALSDTFDLVARTQSWIHRGSPGSDGRHDGGGGLEVGLVLHFTKDRGGGTREGLPSGHWASSNADPDPGDPRYRANATGYRYASFYLRKRREAVALARTMQRWPRTLDVVCGLDVCTDELGVPTWVIQPLLSRVRGAASLAGRATERLGQGPSPVLHTSVHAGEDFVHLATGLRSVDEAIEHLGLREGDRLGHAIALGVDPEDWAYRIGRVAIPREVRLWDLAWEWAWIAGRGGGPVARHAYVERELARLTELCWGRAVEPYQLELLRHDLHDTSQLWRAGFPYGDRVPAVPLGRPGAGLRAGLGPGAVSTDPAVDRLHLLYRYLTDPVWFENGRRVEWIDPSDEAGSLHHLQVGLRDKVADLGLTVEINPTSNLLVGDLGSLVSHPMWRLDPPLPDRAAPGAEPARPVAVAVGSDDPLMFGSSLVEEYNILYDGLMEAGLTDAQARDWLERVRRRGLEARFTRDPADIAPLTAFPNPLRDYPSQLI